MGLERMSIDGMAMQTVPGCARGEGGKGFKRKNEMIRHGLVHESPGYDEGMSEFTTSTRTKMILNCVRFSRKDPMAPAVAADEEAARVDAVMRPMA
ncbi:hypothetical protein NEMBOFW57_000656 [Staphylotrichum longicolle]|uniref:Uncharacterized protein n=1 Tax=Staphylotrichum longicolle TaxID=669026 RepID=A0AAD4EZR6_9PEZI|nr:hypothetical protein NEMBOFW57_000656 [Staphylotrichum longicolle]